MNMLAHSHKKSSFLVTMVGQRKVKPLQMMFHKTHTVAMIKMKVTLLYV